MLEYLVIQSNNLEKKQKKDCIVWEDFVCSEFYRKKRRQDENQMCVCRTNIWL